MNFILRQQSGKLNGFKEVNTCLGKNYTIIYRQNDPERFRVVHPEGDVELDPIIYAFVESEEGIIHELSSQAINYIMNDKGNTFSNVSLD